MKRIFIKILALFITIQICSIRIYSQSENVFINKTIYFDVSNIDTISNIFDLDKKGIFNDSIKSFSSDNSVNRFTFNEINASEYYLKRSKRFNQIGWTFISTGVFISAASLLFIPREGNSYPSPDALRTFFALVGTLPIITSVPFFISAKHNKKIALRMNLNSGTSYELKKTNSNDILVGLSIKLTF
jgi:hypothetical protein